MTQLLTGHLDLNAGAPPQNANLAGAVVNDTVLVLASADGFLAADVIQQVVFTAKLSKTDADNAATTVQIILQNDGSGGITALGTDGTTYLFTFPLTRAQSVILATVHGYDVRVWFQRGANTYERAIQQGTVISYLGYTARTATTHGITTQGGAVLTTEG